MGDAAVGVGGAAGDAEGGLIASFRTVSSGLSSVMLLDPRLMILAMYWQPCSRNMHSLKRMNPA